MKDIMILLAIASTLTSLITEAIKKLVPKSVMPANILAAIVAVLVGALTSFGYIILCDVLVTPKVCVYIVVLIVATWLSAMLGYDKIKQTIQNFAYLHTTEIK